MSASNQPPTNQRVSDVPFQIWALVGIMAAIEVVLSLADRGIIGSPDWRATMVIYGAFWSPLLSGELLPAFDAQPVTMFLSHAFLHGGMFHLLMNTVVLLSLGKFLSSLSGPWPVIGLFAVSAIGGGIVFGLINSSNAPMLGASGAVFGFLGAWQFFEAAKLRRTGQSLKPVFSTCVGLVVANILIALVLQGALAWEAHLGGFIAGILMGPVLLRLAQNRARRRFEASRKF
ncbi:MULTISPECIES: rhomboid family intramembrane serine protease [Halocynthiibacter]|uniref:Rhomboid family intramembrane serine protease n=1 Tax=Halocynthiibacter halioticoli TaxID=2986804 RepID=A0AAE3LQS3_9RHOB|nr:MULTISPECIES: rhomboid family intramembrane serine protease [Halocynthiibacter]MCV6824772.1 rhomboid family intramembrane serine protease [Halocynthiibacter halioticoli]MCW4057773.1 rhomboid family intramembrane serine protease [Halocynthiibacter sp. SDUM655004]MDE0589187.1 rhomboid family intramembrane serine protease [Halocynthiibacter sp. C4]